MVQTIEQPSQLAEAGGPLTVRGRRCSRLVDDYDIVQVGAAQLTRIGLQRRISLVRAFHEPLHVATIGLSARQADRARLQLQLAT